MTEVQALFLILGAIYLLQCIVWVPRDCVVFRRSLRGRWKLAPAGISLEALGLRGIVVNPLPPLPGVIACPPASTFVSPSGVAAEAPKKRSTLGREFLFLSLEQVHSIRTQEKTLLLNESPFAAFMTPTAAREMATVLSKLKKIPMSQRTALLTSALRARFDSAALASRVASCRQHTSLLRFSCNLLFLLLFIVAPVMVWQRGLPATWPYLLAVLLCYLAVITWEFARAHKALYSDAGDQRLANVLSVALSPAGALRANDLLLKDLLREFHAVAVAHQLCTRSAFEALASRVLRELTFPRPVDAEPPADEARLWSLGAEAVALRSFLVKAGSSPAELLGPPPREPECNSFCPRCWSQYTLGEGVCTECGDLKLCAFAANQVAAPVLADC